MLENNRTYEEANLHIDKNKVRALFEKEMSNLISSLNISKINIVCVDKSFPPDVLLKFSK